MIQPAEIKYQGVTGGTFDTVLTLYEGNLQYIWYGVWQPFRTYPINAMVAGPDSNVYAALNEIEENDNPVTDGAVNWVQLVPLDLTGWTGTCTIGTGSLTATVVATMGTTGGTIGVKFTGVQTSVFAAGEYDFNIEVIDTDADNYYPVIGKILFVSPSL